MCRVRALPLHLAASVFALRSLVPAVAGAAEGAHEHGVATLQIVVDGETLRAMLEIPAHDVVGFEHAPATPAERASVDAALARLQKVGRVIAPTPDAGCTLTATQVDSAPGHHDGSPAHADEAHADFRLGYTLRCARPGALGAATTSLFSLLPDLEHLRVQVIGPLGARELLLARPAELIEFTPD